MNNQKKYETKDLMKTAMMVMLYPIDFTKKKLLKIILLVSIH